MFKFTCWSTSKMYSMESIKYLKFYEVMKYPIPKNYCFFLYKKKCLDTQKLVIKEEFSFDKKTKLMEEYIDYINKFGFLYKSIPFVKDIYLCNSITFNALKKESDIDLVIITKKWKLWLARFWSVIFFWILWLKRSSRKYIKKFCLSFYIDEEVQNIENIKLKNDIYLYYWISHCVKLYQEKNTNDFYKSNSWVNSLLPNYSWQQQIFIWNKLFVWKTSLKEFLEFIFNWFIGNFSQKIIKFFWIPILIYKKKKLGKIWKDIIISDKMLKFYEDKRNLYNLLFKSKSQF